LQFADVGNELNDRVLKTVLRPIHVTTLTGSVVTFAGALMAEANAEPPLRELVPAKLAVEERK
jgi:predicted lipoprotein